MPLLQPALGHAEMGQAVIQKTINSSKKLDRMVEFTSIRAHETNKGCRQLIADHVRWCGTVTNDHSQPCVHGDLTQIMPSNSFDPESGFEAKAAQINQAKLRTTQYCFTHDHQCPIFGKRAREVDLDVSGLPCPDFSRAGVERGKEGPTAMLFCSHAKFHAAWQTPMLIIENAPDLDLGMITYLYSKHYRIRCLRVMPAHQGHAGVARDYMVSTTAEYYREASKTARTRGMPLRPVSNTDLKVYSPIRRQRFQEDALDSPYSMRYLLNQREKAAIAFTSQLYKRRRSRDAAADPNLFLNLSDNPGRRLSWSGSWGCLPTFRTNSTRFYNFTREQWMTPRDRLCALGFPVTPNTWHAMGVPMLPVQDENRASSIGGNSFHFSSATIAQLVALAYYRTQMSC
ncbi:unnamed protein product [Durusdinium trenchii]|uniref:DNA (cytosine-5-)-methyltransferase n=1 Tax=Durusdinium trenchii TaxID=1381693 RepID=A0ABP0Q3X3_9DINO